MKYYVFTTFFFLLVFSGCGQLGYDSSALCSINIIDRNGLSQTISSKERLKTYDGVDFLNSCPYQKVMRIFNRDSEGNTRSLITSYHPNGLPKQYLEVINSRANGAYREWHANGKLKLEACVIGGVADIDPAAQADWLFDGLCRAWDEEGRLLAEVPYEKGFLEGCEVQYHPNGQIAKRLPHRKGALDGLKEIYSPTGALLQKTEYSEGNPHGTSFIYVQGPEGCSQIAEEKFSQGLLEQGHYCDIAGNPLTSIVDGCGYRISFVPDGSGYEKQEYRNGLLEGKIEVYNTKGALKQQFYVKNGLKHGDELFYYAGNPCAKGSTTTQKAIPKISVPWYEGKVQGIAKSWYDNGRLESQREFSDNVKQGLSTAWYRDGSLMLIEEYEGDKLVKGEYHRQSETSPASRIIDGKGICTLFDAEGHFIKKINYKEGKPIR